MVFRHPNVEAVVVRRSPVLVCPSQPTPRHVVLLPHPNPCALLNGRDKMYTFHIRAFTTDVPNRTNVHVCEVLRRALEKILVAHYPFAGRVRLNKHGNLEIICNAEGVVFVEAHANETLHELRRLKHLSSAYLRHNNVATFTNVPPLVVQVTELLCGSFVLTLGILKLLSDMGTMLQFINEWVETARGDENVSIIPVSAHKEMGALEEEEKEEVLSKYLGPPKLMASPIHKHEVLGAKKTEYLKLGKDAVGVATSLMAGERMGAQKKEKEESARKATEYASLAKDAAEVATSLKIGERIGAGTEKRKEKEKEKETTFKSQRFKQEESTEKEYVKLAKDALGLATSLIVGEKIGAIAVEKEEEKEKEMSYKHTGAVELKASKKEEVEGKKAEYVKLAKEAVGIATSVIIGEKMEGALAEKEKEKEIKQKQSVGKKMEYMDLAKDAVGLAASLIIGEKMGAAFAEKESEREKKEKEQFAVKYEKHEELVGKKMGKMDLAKDAVGLAASLIIGEKMGAALAEKESEREKKEKEHSAVKYEKHEELVGKKMDKMDFAKGAVGMTSLMMGEKMHAGVTEKGKEREQVAFKYQKQEESVGKKMDYMDLAKGTVGKTTSLIMGEKMHAGVTEKGKEKEQAVFKYQKQEDSAGKKMDYMDLAKGAVGVATSLIIGENIHSGVAEKGKETEQVSFKYEKQEESAGKKLDYMDLATGLIIGERILSGIAEKGQEKEQVSMKYDQQEQSRIAKDAVGLATTLIVEERMHGVPVVERAVISDESVRSITSNVMVDIPIEGVVALKKQLAAQGLRKFTAFEALAAHVWRERTLVLRIPMSQEVKLFFPSDEDDSKHNIVGEGIASTEIDGFHASAFKCKAVTSAGELVGRPLSYGVELIQAAKRRAAQEGLPMALILPALDGKDTGALFLTELSKMKKSGGVGLVSDEFGRSNFNVAGLARRALDYDYIYLVMNNVPVYLVDDFKFRINGLTTSKL